MGSIVAAGAGVGAVTGCVCWEAHAASNIAASNEVGRLVIIVSSNLNSLRGQSQIGSLISGLFRLICRREHREKENAEEILKKKKRKKRKEKKRPTSEFSCSRCSRRQNKGEDSFSRKRRPQNGTASGISMENSDQKCGSTEVSARSERFSRLFSIRFSASRELTDVRLVNASSAYGRTAAQSPCLARRSFVQPR